MYVLHRHWTTAFRQARHFQHLPIQPIFGGTAEIMKEIIGRGPGL